MTRNCGGLDAITLTWDRACSLWRMAALDGLRGWERDKLLADLEPPMTLRVGGVPAWYGSDEEAWADFNG